MKLIIVCQHKENFFRTNHADLIFHRDQYGKNFFKEKIDEKAEQYLGEAVTYTLIELVKDNVESWFEEVAKHKPSKPVPQVQVEQLSEEIAAVVSSFHIFRKIEGLHLCCLNFLPSFAEFDKYPQKTEFCSKSPFDE